MVMMTHLLTFQAMIRVFTLMYTFSLKYTSKVGLQFKALLCYLENHIKKAWCLSLLQLLRKYSSVCSFSIKLFIASTVALL